MSPETDPPPFRESTRYNQERETTLSIPWPGPELAPPEDRDLARDARILDAIRTYPQDQPRTKRTGYPFLRNLRRHAGMPDITSRDLKTLFVSAGLSRVEIISAALVEYTGRRTKRKGWPYLRDLSKQAGFRITRAERKRFWAYVVKARRLAERERMRIMLAAIQEADG